jgi:hypothetical protein
MDVLCLASRMIDFRDSTFGAFANFLVEIRTKLFIFSLLSSLSSLSSVFSLFSLFSLSSLSLLSLLSSLVSLLSSCRTLRKDEKVIAKEVREASEMSHQNIRNGPLPGGELQVREETHQYRTMGKANIRKWVREAAEMGNENIRNGFWSGGKLQVRMKRTTIEPWARKTSGNGCGKQQKLVIKTSEMVPGLEGKSRYV